MTNREYQIISTALKSLELNILESMDDLRDVVKLNVDDDHDCHLTPNGEGHCTHKSHIQI